MTMILCTNTILLIGLSDINDINDIKSCRQSDRRKLLQYRDVHFPSPSGKKILFRDKNRIVQELSEWHRNSRKNYKAYGPFISYE